MASDAAARVSASLIGDLADSGLIDEQDAAERMGELVESNPGLRDNPAPSGNEAAEAVAQAPQDSASAVEEEVDPLAALNPELPPELQEELEEEEIEEMVDNELHAAREERDEEQYDEYEDEATRDLRRRAIAAEKKLEHERKLRARQARGNWEKEATKFFPLAEGFLGKIQADSRRSFLRQAKAYHEAALPVVTQYLEKARKGVTEEARQEAVEAWGKPANAGGDVAAQTVASDEDREIDAIRQGPGNATTKLEKILAVRRKYATRTQ